MKDIPLDPSQIVSKPCEFKIGLYLGCLNANSLSNAQFIHVPSTILDPVGSRAA